VKIISQLHRRNDRVFCDANGFLNSVFKQANITGVELYKYAHVCAENHGWLFGGHIAGHIIGGFYERLGIN